MLAVRFIICSNSQQHCQTAAVSLSLMSLVSVCLVVSRVLTCNYSAHPGSIPVEFSCVFSIGHLVVGKNRNSNKASANARINCLKTLVVSQPQPRALQSSPPTVAPAGLSGAQIAGHSSFKLVPQSRTTLGSKTLSAWATASSAATGTTTTTSAAASKPASRSSSS